MQGADSETPHYVLVGGGLQNGLLMLAMSGRQPEARVTLVERDAKLGGNHTWSFHLSDLPSGNAAWVSPLCEHVWTGYEVAFPNLGRVVDGGYASFSSDHLHREVMRAARDNPNISVRLGTPVRAVDALHVTLSSGEVIEGDVVIDARGPGAYPLRGVRAGYQKFVGLELRLQRPVDRGIPMLMDANVPQTDGFRFFYVLPYAPDRVLIEDTYFSDSPLLDQDGLREEVLAYAARNGYTIAEVVRTEHGVLPLPCGPSPARAGAGALVAGYGGGWFHPATGYSFPVAARLAQHVAETPVGTLAAHWAAWERAQRRQFRYTAFLNWMLFTAFPPERRRNVFERFYRLPNSTIDHFYAHQLTGYDMARILIGRPPRGFSVRMALSGGTA